MNVGQGRGTALVASLHQRRRSKRRVQIRGPAVHLKASFTAGRCQPPPREDQCASELPRGPTDRHRWFVDPAAMSRPTQSQRLPAPSPEGAAQPLWSRSPRCLGAASSSDLFSGTLRTTRVLSTRMACGCSPRISSSVKCRLVTVVRPRSRIHHSHLRRASRDHPRRISYGEERLQTHSHRP